LASLKKMRSNIGKDNSMYTVQVGKGAESQARGQLRPNIKVSPPSFSPMTMVPTAAMLLTKLLTLVFDPPVLQVLSRVFQELILLVSLQEIKTCPCKFAKGNSFSRCPKAGVFERLHPLQHLVHRGLVPQQRCPAVREEKGNRTIAFSGGRVVGRAPTATKLHMKASECYNLTSTHIKATKK